MYTPSPDNELNTSSRYKSGGIDFLFKKNYEKLVSYAEQLTKDRLLAEDIVVDIFVDLHVKQELLRNVKNIEGYLVTSTRNRCYDHLRSIEFLKRWEKDLLYHLSSSTSSDDTRDSSKNIDNKVKENFLCILYVEIENLPKRCGQVLKLLYYNEMKTREVATLLDISEKTVRNHKERAIFILRTKLLKHF